MKTPPKPLPVLLAFAWLAALAASAHAHHVMDYAVPATALDGLLSGLGHPVIGIDHFLFIAGAGVLAARFERGHVLPLIFVFASVFSTMVRYLGTDASLGELPVAGTLVLLGLIMLAAPLPREGVIGVLYLAAGTIHGHALGEAIVGAERAPLVAYLAGLAAIQCAIALGFWKAAGWTSARHPRLPLQKLGGGVVCAAGVAFAAMAL